MALLECCFWFSNRVTRRITWPRPVKKFSAIGFPFPSLAVMFVFIFSNYSLHSHQLKAIDNKQNLHPLDLYRDNKMEANRTLSKQYFSKFEEWVIQEKKELPSSISKLWITLSGISIISIKTVATHGLSRYVEKYWH